MTVTITERLSCRACSGPLDSIWDLGERDIINFGDKEQVKAPLHLMICPSCNLVQLKHTVDADYLFRKYYFKSGTNPAIVNHLKELVEDIRKRVKLEKGDLVVDIGSNDGTFLQCYPEAVRRMGFEPALNSMPPEASKNAFVLNDFFTAELWVGECSFEGKGAPLAKEWLGNATRLPKPKVITALFMFYDLEDPNKFLQDVKKVLAPDGLFIIEMNYLPYMIKGNAIDNVCHEHLCYYSFEVLQNLLNKNGFSVFEYETNSINGGSLRVFATHDQGNRMAQPMMEYMSLNTTQPYLDFKARVLENAYKLHTFIPCEKAIKGLTTAVYGASTRGLILLQLAGLDEKSILYAVERNPAKWGTLYNGIPVVAEEVMRLSPPDYLLILPYSFVDEFAKREAKFLEDGGRFIVPCPSPYLLDFKGNHHEL